MQDKVLKNLPTELLLHTTVRQPTETPLARYVLEDFPTDLWKCSEGTMPLQELTVRHGQLLTSERARIEAITDKQAALEVQLDLVMLLGGYLLDRSQGFDLVPPSLLVLLESNVVRHGIAPRMTYELIVDVNAEAFIRSGGHIRIFSRGDISPIERDFYIGHYFAEKHIRGAYEALFDILEHPLTPHMAERLRTILVGLEQFTSFMGVFGRLPHKEYGYFRRFLSMYPDKIKNASGAFMPSPQLFEMLLHKPGYAQSTYIADNMQYFSQWAQPLLETQQDRANNGQTIEDMLASGALKPDETEAKLLGAIVEQFIRFKLTHITVASSKIPEAFPKPPMVEREELRGFCPFLNTVRSAEVQGKAQGTGGFVPQDFLGDGVRRLLDLQKRLSLPA